MHEEGYFATKPAAAVHRLGRPHGAVGSREQSPWEDTNHKHIRLGNITWLTG